MRLAILSLGALVACSGAPDRRDVASGCAIAVGALELCGPDCAPALDIVRTACTVLAGGRVEACQVAVEALRRQQNGEGPAPLPDGGTPPALPDAGPPGPPGGASLPSAPPGASPTESPSAAPSAGP